MKRTDFSIFTNPTRLDTFGNDNQDIWKKGTLKAHAILTEDLNTYNVSLLEIYDTLRKHRASIAQEQYLIAENIHNSKFKHQTNQPALSADLKKSEEELQEKYKDAYKRFGKIFDEGYGSDSFKFNPKQNIYTHGEGSFIKETFLKMAQILDEQIAIFEKTPRDNATQFNYKEAGQHKNTNEEKPFGLLFIKDDNGVTLEITASGHFMNEEIYQREMLKLSKKYLDNFRENKSSDKEFLLSLGKLSYELSRLYPLKRGTNAVNEWIIQGIAKTFRNMSLGHVRIDGIPFDLYAFVQQDINKYAEKFVSSVEEQLKMSADLSKPPHP